MNATLFVPVQHYSDLISLAYSHMQGLRLSLLDATSQMYILNYGLIGIKESIPVTISMALPHGTLNYLATYPVDA